jgi:hypothetical protein
MAWSIAQQLHAAGCELGGTDLPNEKGRFEGKVHDLTAGALPEGMRMKAGYWRENYVKACANHSNQWRLPLWERRRDSTLQQPQDWAARSLRRAICANMMQIASTMPESWMPLVHVSLRALAARNYITETTSHSLHHAL